MYTISEFAKIVGVTPNTLRRWEQSGKLVPIRLKSKHRRYTDLHLAQLKKIKTPERINVVYIRELTDEQLEIQESVCRQFCINNGIRITKVISDTDTAINYNRKGLQELLSLILAGIINSIVIEHSDRLVRHGFQIIELICKDRDVKIIAINYVRKNNLEESEDLLSIIQTFITTQKQLK